MPALARLTGVVALLCALAVVGACAPSGARAPQPPNPGGSPSSVSSSGSPRAVADPSAPVSQAGSPPGLGGAARRELGGGGASPAPDKVRVAYASISITALPAWVAQDAGTFAKNGLEVALDYVPSGTTLIQSMVAGGTDFAFAGAEAAIGAALAGAPLAIIAPSVDRLTYTVHASNEIADGAALSGRRLGITRAGSSTDFAARRWVETLGMRPDADVALLQLGGQPEILAALQAGAVDAGLLSPPGNTEARRAGYRAIADLSRQPAQIYQTAIVAPIPLIEQRPDVVRRFARAIVEANAVIHRDKAQTKQIIGRYTQSADDEVLEDSYAGAVAAIPRVPVPTRAATELALDLAAHSNPAAPHADASQFFDPRFVQELDDSGFIRGLYP
jgi:NitT/TauT family transport system substrate-binding protein